MLRRLGAASAALLALFHFWLFADQIRDGALLDAGRLLRWGLAGAVAVALWWLRRRGVSLWRSRPAIAVWVIAALLHAPTLGRSTVAAAEASLPDIAATFVPLAIGAVAGLALIAVAAVVRRRFAPPACASIVAPVAAASSRHAGVLSLVSPRPPPLSA